MPFLLGLLAGTALRRWGVIGLFTWVFGIGLVGQVIGANTSATIGNGSAVVFAIGIFVWAMWRPALSEAKLGFLRALRLLIGICMAVTGVIGFVLFAIHGFRFSTPQLETWVFLATSGVCWLALIGFKKWLLLDEQRILAN